jgi:hypothetical protein
MKKCLNCAHDIRNTDIHCRNCGCKLESSKKIVLFKVLTVFVIIGILFMIALFIASYILA